jgi:hypothetical protein
MPMIRFREFLSSYLYESIKKKTDAQTNGDMHELLTGYHLLGGKHMEKHPNSKKETPEEAHDRIKKTMTPQDYDDHFQRAKHAADAILKHVGGRKNIKHVQWSAKSGDVGKITGVNKTQNEDSSDIYITKKNGKHLGISLKAHKEKGKAAHLMAPGLGSIENSLGFKKSSQDMINAARKTLEDKYENEIKGKSRDALKKIVPNNPQLRADEAEERKKLLPAIASRWHKAYSQLPKPELARHLRNLLHANNTGQDHIRVVSSGVNGNYHTSLINTHTQYDHYLNDHTNLDVTHTDNSVNFRHKGNNIVSLRLKTEGGAGILKTIKSDVQLTGASK